MLLLAPEAYWPLRRVGAEFHAAAEGTAALADADELLAAGRPGRARHGAAHRDRARAARPRDRLLRRGAPDRSARPRAARPRPRRDRRAVRVRQVDAPGDAPRRAGARGRRRAGRRHPARRPRPGAGGAAWSAGHRSDRGCWPTRSAPTCGSADPRPATTRCGRHCAASASPTSVRALPHGLDDAARRGRCRPVRGPAGPRRAGPRRARRTAGRAPRRAERPPRRGDRAGPPRDPRPPRAAQPGGRGGPPAGRARGRRPGGRAGACLRPPRRWRRTTPDRPPRTSYAATLRRPLRRSSRPSPTTSVGRGGASAHGHPARRPVHRVRRRPHGDRGLAHHPRQRAAAGALPDGGDRRGPPLRARPSGAPPRRARAQPRRRPPRAGRAPSAGSSPTSSRWSPVASARAAATCSPVSSTTSTPCSTTGCGCASRSSPRRDRRRGRAPCSPASSPRLAGAVVLLVAGSGALAFVLARRGTAAAEPARRLAPRLLGTRVEELAHGLRELEQWGATDRALDAVRDGGGRARPGRTTLLPAPSPTGTALTSAAAGLGVVAVAALVDPAATSPAAWPCCCSCRSPWQMPRRAGRRRRAVGARTCGPRAPRPVAVTAPAVSDPAALRTRCPTATASWCTVPSWGGPTVRRWRSTTSSCVRVSTSGSPGPPGSGSPPSPPPSSASSTRSAARCCSAGPTCGGWPSTTYAAGSGWSTTTPTSSPRRSPRTSGSARPGADDDEVRAALDRACARQRGSTGCPPASTPTSARADARCPAASARAWPWPARCWRTRRCSCSTSRRPTSTGRPRGPSPRRCSTRRPGSGDRSSGSPTARSGWTRWTGWWTFEAGTDASVSRPALAASAAGA